MGLVEAVEIDGEQREPGGQDPGDPGRQQAPEDGENEEVERRDDHQAVDDGQDERIAEHPLQRPVEDQVQRRANGAGAQVFGPAAGLDEIVSGVAGGKVLEAPDAPHDLGLEGEQRTVGEERVRERNTPSRSLSRHADRCDHAASG